MKGKRVRGMPRQKLMDSMMKGGYGKLKEKAQLREEWSHWTFGPAGRQIDLTKKEEWSSDAAIQTAIRWSQQAIAAFPLHCYRPNYSVQHRRFIWQPLCLRQ